MRKLGPSVGLLRFVALILFIALACNYTIPCVYATETEELTQEVAEHEQKQIGYSDRLQELEKQKKENLLTVQDFIYQKSIVEQQLMVLYQEFDVVSGKIEIYDQLHSHTQEELDASSVKLENSHASNQKRIQTLGISMGKAYISALFTAEGKTQLSNNLMALTQLVQKDQSNVDNNQMIEENAINTRQGLENSMDELIVLEVKILSKRQEINDLMLMIANHQEDDRAVKRLQQEQNKIDEELALILNGHDTQSSTVKSLLKNDTSKIICSLQDDGTAWFSPCHYTVLSSPFGMRIHPVYGIWKMHNGVDLSNKCPTQLHAARSGIVIQSGWNGSGGYTVTIDHLDGYVTQYMHMCKASALEKGDVVIAGDVIGCMGTTGTSTGVHLHFGVLKNGQYVDPMDYID